MTSPEAPAPVDDAVIVPPLVKESAFALTVMIPPVAVDATPEVVAESVPPFWIAIELVKRLIFPPEPVPSVVEKMPLPAPSMKTELATLPAPALP